MKGRRGRVRGVRGQEPVSGFVYNLLEEIGAMVIRQNRVKQTRSKKFGSGCLCENEREGLGVCKEKKTQRKGMHGRKGQGARVA